MKANTFKTGTSGRHKMISSIMKLHFTRETLYTKYYRDYRQYDNEL